MLLLRPITRGETSTIVFLGFGFHPQNMEILTPKTGNSVERVYATAMGISNVDKVVIEDRIRSVLHKPRNSLASSNLDIQVRNELSCVDLFSEYQRTLATN